ncbi:hypothetical protein FSP39_013259 [Pinctada imbricata]|uniref:Uncharacterized protein n=1 Tax=Pinctada imbricata TaxID=66713 RepID=A0AA89C1D6_PINIB|nr:hypothetical protein FSP39_013259 [Pinctada imbricata]
MVLRIPGIICTYREEIPENVLQQYKFQILRWLEENKIDETLTVSQFCDWLMNKGVSRDDAYRAFQQFDTDGSGVVEVNTILETVKSSNGVNVLGELGRSIRMLQACSLTPGFVDVYAGDQNAVKQHSDKILKYLLRNRSSSMSLPFPYLNGFNNTANMRLSVLKSTFKNIKESVHNGGTGTLGSGEEVRTISPCYSNIEVSSNTSDSYRLTNDDHNTYWQSDGSARSHFIRLHIKNNVVIKNLSIAVASSDSSYMPELITVSAGKNFRSLRTIKEVRISRVIREAGVSVGDAAAMWYLQILASTVSVTMPLAPHLRTNILEHTKNALGHIPPLSLSPASGDRPQFLSKFVLNEVEKFITDIALNEGEVVPEGLHVLLSLNLARGNVAGLIRSLKFFQEHPDVSLPCAPLLLKAVQARDSCWEKSGHQLTLTLCGTDGGQSDDGTLPENVLSQSWSAPLQTPYVTEEGKTKVSMIFKSTDMMQVTRLRIRVASGAKGAKRGLVFVYRDDSKDFDLSKHIERFEGYDKWGKIEYNFSVQVREAGIAGKPDNPVAYFVFDDCDEIDIPVSWHPVGNYVMVKFLEPRQDNSSKIGVHSIKLYGFKRKLAMVDDAQEVSHPPSPEKRPSCSSLEIINAVFHFLIDLSQDQAQKKTVTSGKPEYLEFSNIPLDTIWELFVAFREKYSTLIATFFTLLSPPHPSLSFFKDEKWQACGDQMLKLLYCLLPVLSTESGECKNSAEAFFQYLGSVIDSVKEEDQSRRHKLCRQLIIDGAAVFFPDKEARRKQLFSMMQNVESLNKAPSVMLVFQSLCQFFSSVDPSGLLDLPAKSCDNFHLAPIMDIMETMISVTYHEFTVTMETGQSHEQVVHLLQLVSSLQTSLLAWCWNQLAPEDLGENIKAPSEGIKEKASLVITRYAAYVATKATEACKLVMKISNDKLEESVLSLETSFLGCVTRQLVLILTFLSDFCDSSTRVLLALSFQNLNTELQSLAKILPKVFPHISSEHWDSIQTEDIVLRTWEIESSHNYDNNQRVTQVLTCPGAEKFVVDFDPRCETERRYDYLVFTDAKGMQMRFDQKVGTSKWPKQVTFSGPHLHFLFHSDSSNTEWGYKFKVTARGSPDTPLSWPFDLQLSLTKLLGRLCGATLGANPYSSKDTLIALEESAEQDVLRSELWTTLFRGGYMIGKLERSLSGKFTAEDSGIELVFLWDLINKKDGVPVTFLQRCKNESRTLMPVGGDSIDAAVTAVFTALVWHTQQLREDIRKIAISTGENPIPEGILLAYSTADSMKMQLLSQRQKLAAEKTDEDVDDPATLCRDKALFLLKFAGLTKIQLKNEMRAKASKQWKKLSNKKSEKHLQFDATEKYPSFRLVLDFVQDPAWTTERSEYYTNTYHASDDFL